MLVTFAAVEMFAPRQHLINAEINQKKCFEQTRQKFKLNQLKYKETLAEESDKQQIN